MRFLSDLLRATFVICGCCLIIQTVANAQSSRDRNRKEDTPTAQALESRLAKAEEALVNEYKDVAVEFYNQGNKEMAMTMLKRLKQLNPKLDGLGTRIESMNEELMQENANELELDTKKSWEAVGDVAEGKPFRIQAVGDYKLTLTTTIGVEGLKPIAESKEYFSEVPLGCLMGLIVSEGKPGKPFPVRSAVEHAPKDSGTLLLKVNVPDGSRCTGKIKVRVSGYIHTGK